MPHSNLTATPDTAAAAPAAVPDSTALAAEAFVAPRPAEAAADSLSAALTPVVLVPGEGPAPLTHFDSPEDVSLPFFNLESVELPENPGVAGTPLPYSFRTDDLITAALLLCFFIAAHAVVGAGRFVKSGLAALVRPRTNDDEAESDNRSPLGTAILVVMTAFAFAILYYDYLHTASGATTLPASAYATLGITMGAALAYMAAKLTLCSVVNHVFFERAKCGEWTSAYLFSTIGMGLLFLPVALLVVYFDLDFEKQVTAFICIVAVGKMYLLLRSYRIFFAYRWGQLHLILYFCTLETVPALFIWRVLFWANTNLTAI